MQKIRVPAQMGKMVADKNKERSARVIAAMMPMVKLDIKKLEAAYHAKPARKATKPRR